MRRIQTTLGVCLILGFLASVASAKQNAGGPTATKEDVERVFQAMHLRDTMKTMMDAMVSQQRQLMHDQFAKTAATAKLPPDFEPKMNKLLDDMMKNFPFEEMIQVMTPVYQKHLTKNDTDAMVAFYSTPTGQKLIRELPAITQEAMQAASPIIQRQMASTMERVQQEVAQMMNDAKAKSGQSSTTNQ
jgi:hypothetical protein